MTNNELVLLGIIVAMGSSAATAIITLHLSKSGTVPKAICENRYQEVHRTVGSSMRALEESIEAVRKQLDVLDSIRNRLEESTGVQERILTTLEDHDRRLDKLERKIDRVTNV